MKGSWPQTTGSQRQEMLAKRAGGGNPLRLPRNREWGLPSPSGGPTQCGGETLSSLHTDVCSWSCPDLPGPWQGASGNPEHRGHEGLYFLSLRRVCPRRAKVCVYEGTIIKSGKILQVGLDCGRPDFGSLCLLTWDSMFLLPHPVPECLAWPPPGPPRQLHPEVPQASSRPLVLEKALQFSYCDHILPEQPFHLSSSTSLPHWQRCCFIKLFGVSHWQTEATNVQVQSRRHCLPNSSFMSRFFGNSDTSCKG